MPAWARYTLALVIAGVSGYVVVQRAVRRREAAQEANRAAEKMGEDVARKMNQARNTVIIADAVKKCGRLLEEIEATNDPSKAREIVDVAGAAPPDPFLLYYKGIGHRHLEQFDEAEAALSKSIALDASSPLAYLERGNLHLSRKAYGKAVADFTDAIAVSPGCLAAFHGRAKAYEALGDKEKAEADFRRAAGTHP